MLAGMIVSASYRTDIPAFYADWFQARLDAGVAEVRNPYGGAPYRVSLRPDEVTGYVFWSRNLAPFSAALERVAEQGVPFVLQFTVTGYPRALETSTIAVGTAVAQLRALAQRYGPRAIVWRYDPVLLTSLTPPDWHRAQVARLARELRGVTDEVCLSFAQIYRKTRRNLEQAAAQHDFAWHDPSEPEKAALLADLAAIAADYSISGTICSQATLGGPPARCIDIGRLSDIAGRALSARTKGNRPGCLCAESRDIGAYDTCPHGCVYCYAVRDRDRAAAAHRGYRAALSRGGATGTALPSAPRVS